MPDENSNPSVLGDTKPAVGDPAAGAKPDAGAGKPEDQGGAKPAPTDDKGKPGEGNKETPKPEDVKYELKTPEGAPLDEKSLGQFTELAKELKIPPEQAQKLVDWYGKSAIEKAKGSQDAWKTTNDNWVKSAKEDKEIGGDKFDATVASAKIAIKKFGNDKLIDALNITGMGNHPEMIRYFAAVAKAFGEDKIIGGQGVGEAAKDPAKILFPNQN